MLGYFGAHPLAARNLRFEIRSDLASVSPNDPVKGANPAGMSLGGRTPRILASESKYSRRRMGSSSTTLYTPAGTPSAATTALAASSCDTEEKKLSAEPGIGTQPRRT